LTEKKEKKTQPKSLNRVLTGGGVEKNCEEKQKTRNVGKKNTPGTRRRVETGQVGITHK